MNKEQENKKDPIRKEGRKRGTITQKMVSFRCDLDNFEWLNQMPNKGRYLNDLLRYEMTHKKSK